jgi:hypothetical protein
VGRRGKRERGRAAGGPGAACGGGRGGVTLDGEGACRPPCIPLPFQPYTLLRSSPSTGAWCGFSGGNPPGSVPSRIAAAAGHLPVPSGRRRDSAPVWPDRNSKDAPGRESWYNGGASCSQAAPCRGNRYDAGRCPCRIGTGPGIEGAEASYVAGSPADCRGRGRGTRQCSSAEGRVRLTIADAQHSPPARRCTEGA